MHSSKDNSWHSGKDTVIAAVAGLAGMLAVAAWLNSRHGAEVRSAIGERFRLGTKQVEQQLKNIEHQLHELESHLQEARRQFAARMQHGGSEGGKGSSDPDKNWGVDPGDVVRELPHLPRR